MKNNFKNMLVAGILTSVFMVGTASAKDGLMMSDFAGSEQTPTCDQSADLTGILMSDLAVTAAKTLTGIMISDRSGLLISDRAGLMLSDRAGIMMSDKAGAGCTDKK